MEGTFLNAWRVGDLEVVSTVGRLFIAATGRRVAASTTSPDESTKSVVERWIREQAAQKPQTKGRKRQATKEGPQRPFVEVRALPRLPGPRALLLLPAPTRPFLLPSGSHAAAAQPEAMADARLEGVQLEERDGQVKIRFAERPRVEIREQLKRAGFRWWSPITGNQHPAWVAPANEDTRQAALALALAYAEPNPGRSAYEEKRVSRLERLKTRAQRAKDEAESIFAHASIPSLPASPQARPGGRR